MRSVLNERVNSFCAGSRHTFFVSFCDESMRSVLNDKYVILYALIDGIFIKFLETTNVVEFKIFEEVAQNQITQSVLSSQRK